MSETFELHLTSANPGIIFDGVGVCTLESSSTLTQSNAFTWGQNIAWTNWRPTTSQGAHAERAFLAGKVWNQNVGWIDLGSSPANPIA